MSHLVVNAYVRQKPVLAFCQAYEMVDDVLKGTVGVVLLSITAKFSKVPFTHHNYSRNEHHIT
jgi:hypothetical protein